MFPMELHLCVLIIIMSLTYGSEGSQYRKKPDETCVHLDSYRIQCSNIRSFSFFLIAPHFFGTVKQEVECGNCSLKTINSNFMTYENNKNNIQQLVLKENGIEVLHDRAFEKLDVLEDLDLSNNDISIINQDTFKGVSSLKRLNLRNNSLIFIPNDSFVKLGNLTTLTLSENRIPMVIGMKAFNGLKTIELLNISNSQISNVTAVFKGLSSLEYLDLSDNSIAILEGNEFEDLESLLKLNLDKNKLESLPEFKGLSSLMVLVLSNNFLYQIDERTFQGLHRLEVLDLSYNQITEIQIREEIFQGLQNILDINLAGNKISSFRTNIFARLLELRRMNLSQNNIEKFYVARVLPIHHLESLDLSDNKLKFINYAAPSYTMKYISQVEFQYNEWFCDLEEEMNKIFGGEDFVSVLLNSEKEKIICTENIAKEIINSSDELSETEDVEIGEYFTDVPIETRIIVKKEEYIAKPESNETENIKTIIQDSITETKSLDEHGQNFLKTESTETVETIEKNSAIFSTETKNVLKKLQNFDTEHIKEDSQNESHKAEDVLKKVQDFKFDSTEGVDKNLNIVDASLSTLQMYLFLIIGIVLVLNAVVIVISYRQYRISQQLKLNPMLRIISTRAEMKADHLDSPENIPIFPTSHVKFQKCSIH